ncbi:hypothetical protein Droror1_Dr00002190 [Drosera rotundifolia]
MIQLLKTMSSLVERLLVRSIGCFGVSKSCRRSGGSGQLRVVCDVSGDGWWRRTVSRRLSLPPLPVPFSVCPSLVETKKTTAAGDLVFCGCVLVKRKMETVALLLLHELDVFMGCRCRFSSLAMGSFNGLGMRLGLVFAGSGWLDGLLNGGCQLGFFNGLLMCYN